MHVTGTINKYNIHFTSCKTQVDISQVTCSMPDYKSEANVLSPVGQAV